MSLYSTDLTPRIGSEVRADRDELLSGRYNQEIREILEQRGVICIPGMFCTDEEMDKITWANVARFFD